MFDSGIISVLPLPRNFLCVSLYQYHIHMKQLPLLALILPQTFATIRLLYTSGFHVLRSLFLCELNSIAPEDSASQACQEFFSHSPPQLHILSGLALCLVSLFRAFLVPKVNPF